MFFIHFLIIVLSIHFRYLLFSYSSSSFLSHWWMAVIRLVLVILERPSWSQGICCITCSLASVNGLVTVVAYSAHIHFLSKNPFVICLSTQFSRCGSLHAWKSWAIMRKESERPPQYVCRLQHSAMGAPDCSVTNCRKMREKIYEYVLGARLYGNSSTREVELKCSMSPVAFRGLKTRIILIKTCFDADILVLCGSNTTTSISPETWNSRFLCAGHWRKKCLRMWLNAEEFTLLPSIHVTHYILLSP